MNTGTEENSPVGGYAIDLSAPRYETVIQQIVEILSPKTYFEVGTSTGASLTIPQCHCIAVDPSFRIERNVIGKKEICQFFQMPSDQFFRKFSPAELLGGTIDLAFLDGMHLYEFLLRDFYNTEKYCRKNSVIMLHDCVPSDRYMAARDEADVDQRKQSVNSGWWTGDVWKVLPILKKYRPELRIYAVNTPPTGLILVTNLDPASKVLEEAYFQILDEFRAGSPDEPVFEDYLSDLKLLHPKDLDTQAKL
ncbi:MAG: class I SAM-dependent methyltransferase, partial [Chthoniobacter sp.]|nr:class I SAM-dependent methyltransferase [Chthoniobacter sp.]